MEMKSTVKGYDFFEVSSAMQKAIRRNDPKLAGYHSGYAQYVWKRLLSVSVEECCGETITTEVYNLFRCFMLINDGRPDLDKGRIFISKAVIICCRSPKCRDADHLQNLIYDRNDVPKEEIEEILQAVREENLPIPQYAYDVHTKKGRYREDKEGFFPGGKFGFDAPSERAI